MSNAFFIPPVAINETVKSYAPGTPEREIVLQQYKDYYKDYREIPMYINGVAVKSENTKSIFPPHDHKHKIGIYHTASENHVSEAINSALNARQQWGDISWEHRASIFLKAADLITGPYRAKIAAATMLQQSKNIFQAEIDAVCEFVDFLRFNVEFATDIYRNQPISDDGIWNRISYRPLEGFVYVVSPFNFTAIAGNLCASAALMGNTIVWKPSDHQVYSADIIMEIFKEAGLPNGVINLIYGDPEMITNKVLQHSDFAGIHYTGSTQVFKNIWTKIGANIHTYKSYPRIVGETGGKDFIIACPTANPKEVATSISRGAFEYQGQKCSAASRVYLPKSIANDVIKLVKEDIQSFKMGTPEQMQNFITAVIHEASFDKITSYIKQAKEEKNAEVVAGGNFDKSKGYFIEPTVIVTSDPNYSTMTTELFGPVVTIYIFEDSKWEETLDLVDNCEYALTGAIFSNDRYVIEKASKKLENAAGNFYINDKPTGAVVGQQPFGGARSSGTNDKAGSMFNLLRWVSPRLIKETFISPKDYRYPFLEKDN